MTNINQIFNEQVVVTNNPSITQDTSVNAIALEGSTITYTPYENSDYVVYEYDFQSSFVSIGSNNSCILHGRLQEYNGSSWVDMSNTGFTHYSEADSSAYPITYRIILDSWSGSKQIRLALKGWTTDVFRGYTAHNAYYGATDDSARKSQAVLSVYSIINE